MNYIHSESPEDPDLKADVRKGDEVIKLAEEREKRMIDQKSRCIEERTEILRLMREIEKGMLRCDPVEVHELVKRLERVTFRWYLLYRFS